MSPVDRVSPCIHGHAVGISGWEVRFGYEVMKEHSRFPGIHIGCPESPQMADSEASKCSL